MKLFVIVFCAIINVNLSYSQILDSNRINYYNSILEGLNKSCIINYTEENINSICKKRFLKDSTEIRDSIAYYNAVKNFYRCDENILSYLVTFERDTTECYWIRNTCSIHPLKSKVSRLITRKRIAALVLIENYLDNNNDSTIRIPRIPNLYSLLHMGHNLCLFEYESLVEWLNLPVKMNRRWMYRTYYSPEYKIYSDYYYGM